MVRRQVILSPRRQLYTDSRRMSKVCESWPLEDLCEMDDQDMEQLLGFYQPNKVPSLVEIRVHEEPSIVGVDGAFGWW